MSNIFISESYVNQDEDYIYGETGVYEAWTDNRAKLFRSLQKEYGRCASAVYVDQPDGKSLKIGWCFEKRVEYERSHDAYIREVWITLHEAPPTRTVEYHYAAMD